jgi:hypothetical protein
MQIDISCIFLTTKCDKNILRTTEQLIKIHDIDSGDWVGLGYPLQGGGKQVRINLHSGPGMEVVLLKPVTEFRGSMSRNTFCEKKALEYLEGARSNIVIFPFRGEDSETYETYIGIKEANDIVAWISNKSFVAVYNDRFLRSIRVVDPEQERKGGDEK